MAAATEPRRRLLPALWAAVALSFLGPPTPGAAEDPGREAGEEAAPDGTAPHVDAVRLRMSVLRQTGHGYQSQEGPPNGPGSESLWVFQPMAQVGVVQNERVHHTVTLPLDIVTSASTDALDAVSSASRVNEAGTLELVTDVAVTPDDHLSFVTAYHHEEPWRSATVGAGYTRDLAQDNATLGANLELVLDWFDPIGPSGFDAGFTNRQAVSGNLAFSQVLSRTTLFAASYGLTFQTGQLATTWNSTPQPTDVVVGRLQEQLPPTRLRHALSGELLQHVPPTRTTLRAHYRFYADDFGLFAHTLRLSVAQRAGQLLVVRPSYRWHRQTGVRFYRESVPVGFPEASSVTSDSDLAPLSSHELGLKLVLAFPDASGAPGTSVDVAYFRYLRTNDLDIHLATLGVARTF